MSVPRTTRTTFMKHLSYSRPCIQSHPSITGKRIINGPVEDNLQSRLRSPSPNATAQPSDKQSGDRFRDRLACSLFVEGKTR